MGMGRWFRQEVAGGGRLEAGQALRPMAFEAVASHRCQGAADGLPTHLVQVVAVQNPFHRRLEAPPQACSGRGSS